MDVDEEEEEEEDDEDFFVYDMSMCFIVWFEFGVVVNIGGIGSDELIFLFDMEWIEFIIVFMGF